MHVNAYNVFSSNTAERYGAVYVLEDSSSCVMWWGFLQRLSVVNFSYTLEVKQYPLPTSPASSVYWETVPAFSLSLFHVQPHLTACLLLFLEQRAHVYVTQGHKPGVTFPLSLESVFLIEQCQFKHLGSSEVASCADCSWVCDIILTVLTVWVKYGLVSTPAQ